MKGGASDTAGRCQRATIEGEQDGRKEVMLGDWELEDRFGF